MPFFQGASRVTIHGGQFQDVNGDAHSFVDASRNVNSFNTSETVIRDSYNNGYRYGNPPGRPRRNNPGWGNRDEYDDDGGYDPYPNPPYPPHRSYTSSQPPRQQPHYPPRQNPNQRWPPTGYDYEPEPMATSSDWTPRPQHQYRRDTPDFDTVFGGDAYPQWPPPHAPQPGPTMPIQQPFYSSEPASEPALSSNVRTSSKNPFAQFLNADSQPSLVRRMDGLVIEEQRVQLAPEPQFLPDRPLNGPFPSPHAEPEHLDDSVAFAIADRILPVISDQNSYQQLLHMERPKAQRLVDIAQMVLENPRVDPTPRRKLVVSMRRFAKSANVCPRSYKLEGVTTTDMGPTGEGAFGTVYKGAYQGRIVCLKALKRDGRTTAEKLSKAVAREAILWKQLNHQNILPFYGICALEVGLCMVSPWMRLGNLPEYIRRGVVHAKERLLIARDVAEGLKYLHSYDIVHGDLKGNNVLIDGMGRARIADFGLTAIDDPDIAHWTSQSQAASRGGTAAFQAPEILLGGDAGEKVARNTMASDMYAWGCVCYELFVGEVPYKGNRDHVVMQKMRYELPQRPDDNHPAWRRHGLTEKLWSFMDKAWSIQPELRPTASDAVEKLSEMIDYDHRPQEEEQEPEANFISRWFCAPIGNDMGPSGMRQKFKNPTIEEVEELLKL